MHFRQKLGCSGSFLASCRGDRLPSWELTGGALTQSTEIDETLLTLEDVAHLFGRAGQLPLATHRRRAHRMSLIQRLSEPVTPFEDAWR